MATQEGQPGLKNSGIPFRPKLYASTVEASCESGLARNWERKAAFRAYDHRQWANAISKSLKKFRIDDQIAGSLYAFTRRPREPSFPDPVS